MMTEEVDTVDTVDTVDATETKTTAVGGTAGTKKENGAGAAQTAYEAMIREAKEYPLLTLEEEVALGKLKEAGGEAGEEAREKLINSNLRLVFLIANKRARQLGPTGSMGIVSVEDLVQEGALGLIKAVDKYDWRRGCRFSTNAVEWITMSINQSLTMKARTIRLPHCRIEQIRALKRVKEKKEKEREQNIVDNHADGIESCDKKATAEDYCRWVNEGGGYNMSSKHNKIELKKIKEILNLIERGGVSSLDDDEISDDSKKETEDISGERPEQYVVRIDEERRLLAAVRKLRGWKRVVINVVYGVSGEDGEAHGERGGKEMSLEEAATVMYKMGYKNHNGERVSREGVRQLKNQALKQLRELMGSPSTENGKSRKEVKEMKEATRM